jgi:hypothetical protein
MIWNRNSSMRNISTRGLIVGGQASAKVIVRAIGPSLADAGVSGALHGSDRGAARQQRLTDFPKRQLAQRPGAGNHRFDRPANERAGIGDRRHPPAGAYTAIVHGAGDTTGVALVEVYALNP